MPCLKKSRQLAFDRQRGCCHYCGLPVWLRDPDSFRRRYGLTSAEANLLQCTAEHLVARCDGGSDRPDNIVAACRHCNSTRHRRSAPLDPATYRQYVRRRVAKGRWHHPSVLRSIQSTLTPPAPHWAGRT